MSGHKYTMAFNEVAKPVSNSGDPALDKSSQEFKNIQRSNLSDSDTASHMAAGDTLGYSENRKKRNANEDRKQHRDKLTWQQIIKQINDQIINDFKAMDKLINEMYEGANKALNSYEMADALQKQYQRYQEQIAEAVNLKNFELDENGKTNNPTVNKYLEDYRKRNPNASQPESMDNIMHILAVQSNYVDHNIIPELESIKNDALNLHDRWLGRAQNTEKTKKEDLSEWEQIQAIEDPEEKAKALESFNAQEKAKNAENVRLNTADIEKQASLDERFTQISKNATEAKPEIVAEMSNEEGLGFGIGLPKTGFPSP